MRIDEAKPPALRLQFDCSKDKCWMMHTHAAIAQLPKHRHPLQPSHARCASCTPLLCRTRLPRALLPSSSSSSSSSSPSTSPSASALSPRRNCRSPLLRLPTFEATVERVIRPPKRRQGVVRTDMVFRMWASARACDQSHQGMWSPLSGRGRGL